MEAGDEAGRQKEGGKWILESVQAMRKQRLREGNDPLHQSGRGSKWQEQTDQFQQKNNFLQGTVGDLQKMVSSYRVTS